MNNDDVLRSMRAAVETELRDCVDSFLLEKPEKLKEMVLYPLGLAGGSSAGEVKGKRLRPVILLATSHAMGLNWQETLPAAVAFELVHNFSLVHDDIQDRSDTRRGQPTVWKKWGEAQAINVGDALLAISSIELQNLKFEHPLILRAISALNAATLQLTVGQYLDIAFEKAEDIQISSYWQMVAGKTGALFGACFALPAILAGKNEEEAATFGSFGRQLGCAFQVQDDYLGIFGDDKLTGKSVVTDLADRKKTYPILYGLENISEFRQGWTKSKEFSEIDLLRLRGILEASGVREHTEKFIRESYERVETEFELLFAGMKSVSLLRGLVDQLLNRIK